VRRALAIAVALAVGVGSPAAAAPPKVSQLVVFRDGAAKAKSAVSTRAAKVSVGGRRCTAADGTALAALVRSKPGRLRLHDFGSCSLRPSDGGGLFVRAIGGDANHGQDGWVYKVGRRSPSTGAADTSARRLRGGDRVLWFWCDAQPTGGCQRTLEATPDRTAAAPGEALRVTVRGYDDNGRGTAIEGATVVLGSASAVTGADGVATVTVPSAGRLRLTASKPGAVRSFPREVRAG
jgi:hypothetical protein